MKLGQFPAHGHAPVRPEGIQKIPQGRGQLVGSLVKDHGARLVLQLSQPVLFLAPVGGQKALKHKTPRHLTGHTQRRDGRAGRRHRAHGNASGMGVPHDDLTRVGHRRHARVGTKRAVFPGRDAVQDILAPLLQVVFIIADQRLFDSQMIEQFQRDAGILRRDKIHFLKGPGRPGRQIAQVPDGGCHNVKGAAHGFSSLVWPYTARISSLGLRSSRCVMKTGATRIPGARFLCPSSRKSTGSRSGRAATN